MEQFLSDDSIFEHADIIQSSFVPASGKPSTKEIGIHIEKYIGKVEMVMHEIISEYIDIKIHWVKPTKAYPFHTLITSGMSDLAMNTPKGEEDFAYAELCISLPPEWKVSQEDFAEEKYYWPVKWLKSLARFPHIQNSFITAGHTVPNGNPPQNFVEATDLNTMILLNSVLFDEGFHQLKLKDKIINFYAMIPLYTEEANLKLKKGPHALFKCFNTYGVSDLLDINRANTVIIE